MALAKTLLPTGIERVFFCGGGGVLKILLLASPLISSSSLIFKAPFYEAQIMCLSHSDESLYLLQGRQFHSISVDLHLICIVLVA